MNSPTSYTLFAGAISTALTAQAQTAITDLEGALAATIVVRLAYGSGGTSIAAVVQTSVDGGTNWLDVARLEFATASATKYANLSGLTAKANTSYSALSAEGVNDGILGPRFRAVLTTVGTYADTTFDVRLVAR